MKYSASQKQDVRGKMQPGNQDTAHCFTCKKEDFETLRNPRGNEDFLQVVTIRPGLHITTFQTDPQVMPRYNFDVEDMPVGFSFQLSGKIETTCEKGLGRTKPSIVNQRGVNSVMSLHDIKGYSQYLSHEILDAVTVSVDPRMFTDLIAEELDGISKDCHNLLQQKNLFFSLPMTKEMYNVAASALHHPYQGTAARLHVEACGLELLALQLDRLTRQNIHREKPLRRCDEERIRMAGDILIQKMESPPTIPVLARQVGMNSSKLQRGFKQVFGITVGQFLLRQRMTCARGLLLNRETDVAQAALAVGYSNVSHFIRCYKKTFGVTPGSHQQTFSR